MNEQLEAKSEPFYYIKMFHTNDARTLVSYCFRHKFFLLFEFQFNNFVTKCKYNIYENINL